MKTPVRNFFHILRIYPKDSLLNIFCLSIAFSIFYILLSHILWEWTFDGFHKDAASIYRVEIENEKKSRSDILNYTESERILKHSPHIVAGGIYFNQTEKRVNIKINEKDADQTEVPMVWVSPDFPNVFTFDMHEGSANCLKDPEQVIMPLSIARRLFGESKSYLDNDFIDENGKMLRIKGIYRDFPTNTRLSNIIYRSPDASFDQELHYASDWNCRLYLKLNIKDNDRLFENYRQESNLDNPIQICLRPLKDIYFAQNVVSLERIPGGNRQLTYFLLFTALFILVIAGINFLNFASSLIPVRIKSINTMKIFGATSARLRISLLLETVILLSISCFLSFVWIELFSNTSLNNYLNASIALPDNQGLAAFTLLVALFAGFSIGLYPAFYMTSFPPILALKGLFIRSLQGRVFRNTLVCFQLVIAIILTVFVFFIHAQLGYMQNDLGFNKDHILVVENYIGKDKSAFINKLKEHSAIENAAFSELTLGGNDFDYPVWGFPFQDKTASFDVLFVTSGYLNTMGISVKEGRDFREEDGNGSLIFNECARQAYDLHINDQVNGKKIIGFVPDVHFRSFRESTTPMAFYFSNDMVSSFKTTNIRFKEGSNRKEVESYINNVYKTLYTNSENATIRTYDEILKELYQKEKKQSNLISGFSFIALLICIAGIFELVNFDTQSRRKEIGLRKMHGATRTSIVWLFNKTYLSILCVSSIIATPIAIYGITRWLENFTYHIPVNGSIFLFAVVVVLFMVVATVTNQCWQTANENPVKSIRTE